MSLKHFFKPDKNFGKDAKELIPQLIFGIIVCGLAVGAFVFFYPALYRIYTILPPISIHIAIGIILAYFIMFILRLFFGNSTKEDISEIKKLLTWQGNMLEKQKVEKQNGSGIYTLEDVVKEIRDLTYAIENIERYLKEIERYAEEADTNIWHLRNDYHYKHYYKKGCYDEYCIVCKDLKSTEDFNKEFPPTLPEEE